MVGTAVNRVVQNGITVTDCQAIDEKSPTETYSEDTGAHFCPNSVESNIFNNRNMLSTANVDMTLNNLAKKTIIEALNK